MTGMPSAQVFGPLQTAPAGKAGTAADCTPCNGVDAGSGAVNGANGAAVDRMTSLVDRLGRAVHCIQFADGLNPAQWAVLRYLGRANRYSRTPTAISEYLGTTRGTMSQTIKALEAKGLIGRVSSDRDRRAVLLKLTEQGEDALKSDPLSCVDAVARALGDEMDEASHFLDRLVDCLQTKTGGAGYGVCVECTHFCKDSFAAGTHRCGLTGDPLSVKDSTKICVNFTDPPAV